MLSYNYDSQIMDDPKPSLLQYHLMPQTKSKLNYQQQNKNALYQKQTNSFGEFGIEVKDQDQVQESKTLKSEELQIIFFSSGSDSRTRKQNQSNKGYFSALNSSSHAFYFDQSNNPINQSKRRGDSYSMNRLLGSPQNFQIKKLSYRNSKKLLEKEIQRLIGSKNEKQSSDLKILNQSKSFIVQQSILKSPERRESKNLSQKVRFKVPSLVNKNRKLVKNPYKFI